MSQPSTKPQAAYYPIRIVSNETGVNAITLRAWERRYGLITPKRTEKGHRLYTENDILLIKQVVSLLERGIPISQAKLILENAEHPSAISTVTTEQPSQWHQYLAQLNMAIKNFDDAAIASVLNDVTRHFPIDITLRFLLLPIYSQLREQRSQPLGQARLQFFGGYIHAKLATRLTEIPDAKDSITLVLANTTYDDDLELLLLAILVRQLGVRILRLAGLTQAPDIAELINTLSLQGALIKAPDQANDVQLKQLQNLSVETGQLIFVSGNTPAQADVLRRRGLMPLSGDIQQDARTIRDVLAGINS